MNFLKRVVNAISHRNKRETLYNLQAMSTDQLIDSGFSPALVKEGISAWPWREDHQSEKLSRIEWLIAEEQRCVNELERYTDSELNDLGLSRGSIRQSVRHGLQGIDKNATRRAA